MIDQKFTEKIVRWLEAEHDTIDKIEEGAQLLLSMNRDYAMFQRIMRRPEREVKFLEYKLRRFLRIRQDGQTIRDVVRLDNEITPALNAAFESEPVTEEVGDKMLPCDTEQKDEGKQTYYRKGIRPDHDCLPADIQEIWTKNAERWKKIKQTFETCKNLTEPCDRYEYLKVLKDDWYTYKMEMARYDDYRLTDDTAKIGDDAAGQTLTPEQEKELSNADSYISKNMPQMMMLVDAEKGEDFNEDQKKHVQNLRERIQKRVDVLLKYGRILTDERREQLMQCDIKVTLETTEDNEQGKDSK